jgi:hypothetical protein
VDPDAHLKIYLYFSCELRDGFNHLEAASNYARRIVLVRKRVAEIHVDAVAPVLSNEALVANGDGFARLLV